MKSFLVRLGLILVLLSQTNTAVADTPAYEEYVKGLDERFEAIQHDAESIDKGAIFAARHIENTSLQQSGRNFIEYLYENHATYQNLSFSEWISATDELLKIDREIGQHVAWGNLVIKMKVCNDVLNQMAVLLLDEQRTLSSDELEAFIALVQRLRLQLPSEQAMMKIATRLYEFDPLPVLDVDRLDYIGLNLDFGDREAGINGSKLRQLPGTDRHYRARLDDASNQEVGESQNIGDFYDLYVTPIPISIAAIARYRNATWDIYFKLLLLDSGKLESNPDWSTIDEEVVRELLATASQNSQSFWMGDRGENFDEKEVARKRYMEHIRVQGGLRSFIALWDFRERIRTGRAEPPLYFQVHLLK